MLAKVESSSKFLGDRCQPAHGMAESQVGPKGVRLQRSWRLLAERWQRPKGPPQYFVCSQARLEADAQQAAAHEAGLKSIEEWQKEARNASS